MELLFSESAKKELADMPQDMKIVFLIHLEKVHSRPPRKTYEIRHSMSCGESNETSEDNLRYQ